MRLSRKLWQLDHYRVPAAGRKVRLSRSGSYRAAESGLIPTVEDDGYLWVPKKLWDQRVKKLLRGSKSRRKPARAEETADT